MTDTRSKYRRTNQSQSTSQSTRPEPQRPRRRVNEVVELDRDCELGSSGERAVVTAVDGQYMVLVFPYRVAEHRVVRTETDYTYLREV